MIKASQGDRGAFVSAMEFEMSEGLTDLKNDVNRQIYFDGTGTIATVSANAVGSNVITVTGRTSAEAGNKYVDVGVVVDIYSSAGALMAQGVGITAVSGTTTATLTLDNAVTTNSTDILVHSGSKGNEIQGLLTSQDGGTSTIFNVDRSAYFTFTGNKIDAGGAQLTLASMQQAYNEARRRGGAKINAVFSDFDSERYYNKLLVVDKRYIGKVPGDGGEMCRLDNKLIKDGEGCDANTVQTNEEISLAA